MAHLPRFVIPDHPQHVIFRGNNREPIFIADDDYQFYLEKLKQACGKPIESDPVDSLLLIDMAALIKMVNLKMLVVLFLQ